MKLKNILILSFFIVLISCVPKRQMDDMESKYNAEKQKREELAEKARNSETALTELQFSVEENIKRLKALKRDTSIQGVSLRQLTGNYDQLNKTYRELLDLQEKIKQGSQAEAKKYLIEIDKARIDLQDREDQLNTIQQSLKEKESRLENLNKELEARERKVKELQSIINKQDSASTALRNKLQSALLGFKDKGLTVTMKNGKVYISLENELMFSSGSWNVGKNGSQALKKLAEVLVENPDINITVEGHTDTDKYYGKGELKDNWDLSVKRATEIVKILVKNNVNPINVTASGRGEFIPLNTEDTPQAKKENRRTEIILTPKLNELFNLLETEN